MREPLDTELTPHRVQSRQFNTRELFYLTLIVAISMVAFFQWRSYSKLLTTLERQFQSPEIVFYLADPPKYATTSSIVVTGKLFPLGLHRARKFTVHVKLLELIEKTVICASKVESSENYFWRTFSVTLSHNSPIQPGFYLVSLSAVDDSGNEFTASTRYIQVVNVP